MEDNICAICLDDSKPTNLLLRCNHPFHTDCITDWLARSTTCPNCRVFININYPFEASENLVFRKKILVVLNDKTITFFKNNNLTEILPFNEIKTIRLGNLFSVIINKSNDTVKKIYFNSRLESAKFFDRLKDKMDN